MGRIDVNGKALLDDLCLALGTVLHGDHDALSPCCEIHRASHAWNHLAGNHPVREKALLVDLKPAEHGHVNVPTADQAEGHGAVECACSRKRGNGSPSCIGQTGLGQSVLGGWDLCQSDRFSDWKNT